MGLARWQSSFEKREAREGVWIWINACLTFRSFPFRGDSVVRVAKQDFIRNKERKRSLAIICVHKALIEIGWGSPLSVGDEGPVKSDSKSGPDQRRSSAPR